MTRFYVDLSLLDQKNLGKKMLSHVYSDLQRTLATNAISDVAIGFPEFGALNPYGDPSLGEVLRLVSSDSDRLNFVVNQPAIKTALTVGVLKASKISQVPDDAKEIRFVRNQKPGREKRRQLTEDACSRPRYDDLKGRSISILIKRLDGSVHPVFLDRVEAGDRISGNFSSFGLSKKDGPTFPHF